MRLAVGPTGNDASYDLTVMLNDHMLFSRRLPAQTERISQSLLLPAKHQQSENKLEISLAKADLNLNRCGTETQSMAELLPETMLRGGGEKASGNLSILQAQLRAANMVALVGDINTAVDAQAVAQLLGQLEPRGLSFVKGTSGANIRIVIGDLAAGIAKKGAQPTDWVIYRSMDRNVGIVVRPASQIEALTAPAIALLISIPSNGKDNRQSGNAG